MSEDDYFWKASIEELKQGYYYYAESHEYICLICGECFENGVIYPYGDKMYTAEKFVKVHIESEHESMFTYFLGMRKTYTGLTDNQKELMHLFYRGCSDKEIVEQTDVTSTSTIRNQRFQMKEKYKQAKIIVAMYELLEERRENMKKTSYKADSKNGEELIEIHRTATCLDSRFAITQAEKDEIIKRYFDENNKLVIKEFPPKEKRKIIIMQHIIKDFDSNKKYTEKEVNTIIEEYYEDSPTIRRYLIQYGFLDRERDGKAYWVKMT